MAKAHDPARSALRPPTLWDIACQVKRDLFGKDVQDTPTASYAWIGDQFGHFALGFEISFALSWLYIALRLDRWMSIYWIPGAILVGFVVKELSDYVTARNKAQESKSDFPFDRAELFWNMGTAVGYILLGVAVATPAVVLAKDWATEPGLAWVPLGLLLPVALMAAMAGVWWLGRKITFQQAGLPMMYRLAIFPNYLGEGPDLKSNIDFIDNLIRPKAPPGRHLVIAGPPLAGKSSLATGVGTEFAFNEGIARYTTLMKLLEAPTPVRNPQSQSPTEFQDGRILWPWETADLLIVDDVDYVSALTRRVDAVAGRHLVGAGSARHAGHPGGFREEAAAGPDALDAINHVEGALSDRLGTDFLRGLATRRSVWVVGDGSDAIAQAWLAMVGRLLGLEGEPDAVKLVHLKLTIEDALAKKGAPDMLLKKRPWLLRNLK